MVYRLTLIIHMILLFSAAKLRAIGTSMHLKAKYGLGYRISLIAAQQAHCERLKKKIKQLVPQAELQDESAGTLIYQIATEDMCAVPALVRHLEMNVDGDVRHWGVSCTTLEEVFLHIIKMANPGGYAGTL